MPRQILLSLEMTTCFHIYAHDSAWRTDAGNRTRSVDLALIRCLFRLVKCKFTEPLYKSARYTLLSLLKFRTNAQSVKWEGRNLMEKKTWKYCGWHGCWIPLRFCSSIARYCDTVVITTALIPWASNTIVSSSSCKSRECKRPLKNRQIRA